jgi:predicted RNA-binding protein
VAKQEITAAEVRKGDRIKVKFVVEDTTITREGVVHGIVTTLAEDFHFSSEKGYSLGPTSNSTIYLLERPKPVNPLPIKEGGVVQYTVDFDDEFPDRTAIRTKDGWWKSYNNVGELNYAAESNEEFYTYLTNSLQCDFDIIFQGVSK